MAVERRLRLTLMKIEKERTLRVATVVYLVTMDKVLFGKKVKHIGRNRLNGPGGGVKEGETIEEAAVRELHEEIGVTAKVTDLEKIAEITFTNTLADQSQHPCTVHFYVVRRWTGDPTETDEMCDLEWFPLSNLPLKRMMPGDQAWIIDALVHGRKVRAEIAYGPGQYELLSDPVINVVESFDG
jgi:mutator protein MutT